MPSGWKRAGKPDPRVADRGPDFEHATPSNGHDDHPQQRPDLRIDERQILLFTVAGDVEQQWVRKPIETREVSFNEVWNDSGP